MFTTAQVSNKLKLPASGQFSSMQLKMKPSKFSNATAGKHKILRTMAFYYDFSKNSYSFTNKIDTEKNATDHLKQM